MKEIGNIHLCWRPGKGSKRIAVGIIRHSVTGGVRFNYIQEGVKSAKLFGFTSYEGFPEIDKVYTENVIEIFGQRIVKSERSDTTEFYDFWGIDRNYKDNDVYMLAYTQGLIPTDNFEFLADFNPIRGLTFVSEIAGLSNAKIPSNQLQIGDSLFYELDSTNIHDKNAVKLFHKDVYVGYVKLIHCRVFHKVNSKFNIVVHSVEANGLLKRVFIKISL